MGYGGYSRDKVLSARSINFRINGGPIQFRGETQSRKVMIKKWEQDNPCLDHD
jgi:hypothetical protein